MALVSRSRFAGLLGGLSREAFAAFVADLWAARGWETETPAASVVVAERSDPPEQETLLVHHGAPFLSRDSPATEKAVTTVVTSGTASGQARQLAEAHDATLLDRDDLYEMAVYALDPDSREALFRRHFDRPATVPDDAGVAALERAPTPRATVLLVAAVLVVAAAALGSGALPGVVGGGGDALPTVTTATPEPFGGFDGTPTVATPTPVRTPTRTPTPVASARFRAAVSGHAAALRIAGQFVVRETFYQSFGAANLTAPVQQSFAVDLVADRYWFGVSDPADGVYDSGQIYQANRTVYRRNELPNGTVRYRRVFPAPEPTPREWALGWITGAPDRAISIPFERNGTGSVAGEEMARYTASTPGRFGCIAGGENPSTLKNVTGFTATALVDERGIIRSFECELRGYLPTGDRYTERATWRVVELGTAVLKPPEPRLNGTEAA